MKITKRTKVKDITPFLTTERFNSLLEAVEEYPLETPVLKMTVGQFAELTISEEDFIRELLNPNERVFKAFGRLKSYRNQMTALTKYLEGMQLKLTSDEKLASQNVDMPTTAERMLLDCVKFFHLHSMEEAEKIPISDWLVVLKDQVATAKYSRNYQKILEQRSKSKTKRK